MAITEQFVAWIDRLATVYNEQKSYLTDLDSAIGDADHGTNMARGFRAASEALKAAPPADVGVALKTVSMTLLKSVGGASGPLFGTFFLKAALTAVGKGELSAREVAELFEAGIEGVKARGKAVVGDKTMIDAWEPAREAFVRGRGEGVALEQLLEGAVTAAAAGRDSTVPLVARKGRASYLGERSRDHMDPGAASTVMMIEAARATLTV